MALLLCVILVLVIFPFRPLKIPQFSAPTLLWNPLHPSHDHDSLVKVLNSRIVETISGNLGELIIGNADESPIRIFVPIKLWRVQTLFVKSSEKLISHDRTAFHQGRTAVNEFDLCAVGTDEPYAIKITFLKDHTAALTQNVIAEIKNTSLCIDAFKVNRSKIQCAIRSPSERIADSRPNEMYLTDKSHFSELADLPEPCIREIEITLERGTGEIYLMTELCIREVHFSFEV